jgi:hypothetical protein
MSQKIVSSAVVLLLCFTVSVAQAQRGRGGGREGGRAGGGARGEGSARSANKKPPGGNWSQRSMGGNQGGHQAGNSQHEGAKGAAAANKRNQPQASGGQGAAAENRKQPSASGAQGAAAGAAAENRRQPTASGAQGAAAGAAAANRNQPQYSGAEGAVAGSAAVRNNYEHSGVYGQSWYGAHTTAWAPTAWVAGSAWTPTTYGAVASHCGYAAATPVSYDYGNNVTCNNGNVTVNGQPAGTAEEFSQQADDLAQTGVEAQPADTDKWMPLGVFAMVRDETQHPHLIMQLAVNQQGILRGNYTDEVTDSVQPIHGSVDQKTQRAAWTVGDNKTTVMEAGLSNLSQGEAPALIHKNGTTDRWLLVRLNQPDQNAGGTAPASK